MFKQAFCTYNFALCKCTHSRISSLKKFMFIKAMAKNFMYKVPAYFRVCFCDHNCQSRIPNCVEISTKSLSKRENSAAIFLVFLRVNPIAQRAYYRFLHCCYRFLHCCYRFLHCVTDFCTVLGDVWD